MEEFILKELKAIRTLDTCNDFVLWADDSDLEHLSSRIKKAITVTHCCTQLPTFDESNLNKNEYADDVQKTIHKNLCKPSYKIGWENCYSWLKQSLKK